VLDPLRSCFTAPTFEVFTALVAGLVAQPVGRTVCGMLTGAGLAGVWQHCRAHRFFSAARWCPRQVGLVLAGLVVAHLLPEGAPVTVAVDDTLFRRRGKKVHGAGWFHDGSAVVDPFAGAAWVDDLPEDDFSRCAALPDTAYLRSLTGLDQQPTPDRNICVRTSEDNQAIVRLDMASTAAEPSLNVHYLIEYAPGS